MDNSALRPGVVEFPSMNSPIEVEERVEVNAEDVAVHQVVASGGWGVIERDIIQLEEELEHIFSLAVSNPKATFEEIGQKAMIKVVATEYLEKVREKVRDRYESVETRG